MAAVIDASQPRIAGDGVCEHAWKQSRWLESMPQVQAASWLAGARRLVVVAPHPDDEVLGAGGLIATAHAAGIPVRVVSVTDGEACYPGSSVWPEAHLRQIRRRELVAAMACLGVQEGAIDTLDLGDGKVAAQEDALVSALVDLLHWGDRVLTTFRGDGHPDHEATARAVDRAGAARAAEVAQFPVWAWHWMDPVGSKRQLPQAQRCMLDAAAVQAKARALSCFASQRDSGDPAHPPILPPHVLARFDRCFEVVLP